VIVGNVDLLRFLIQNEANFRVKDSNEMGSQNIINNYLKHHQQLSQNIIFICVFLLDGILVAALSGNVNCLEYLDQEVMGSNYIRSSIDKLNRTALFYAVRGRDQDVFNRVLEVFKQLSTRDIINQETKSNSKTDDEEEEDVSCHLNLREKVWGWSALHLGFEIYHPSFYSLIF